eukprot:284658-Rhodomonas_salina.1
MPPGQAGPGIGTGRRDRDADEGSWSRTSTSGRARATGNRDSDVTRDRDREQEAEAEEASLTRRSSQRGPRARRASVSGILDQEARAATGSSSLESPRSSVPGGVRLEGQQLTRRDSATTGRASLRSRSSLQQQASGPLARARSRSKEAPRRDSGGSGAGAREPTSQAELERGHSNGSRYRDDGYDGYDGYHDSGSAMLARQWSSGSQETGPARRHASAAALPEDRDREAEPRDRSSGYRDRERRGSLRLVVGGTGAGRSVSRERRSSLAVGYHEYAPAEERGGEMMPSLRQGGRSRSEEY